MANLDREGNTRIILEESGETVLDILYGTVKVLRMQFH